MPTSHPGVDTTNTANITTSAKVWELAESCSCFYRKRESQKIDVLSRLKPLCRVHEHTLNTLNSRNGFHKHTHLCIQKKSYLK